MSAIVILREILVTEYKFARTILTEGSKFNHMRWEAGQGRGRVGGFRVKFIHELICKSFHNQIYSSTIKILTFVKPLRLKGENWAYWNNNMELPWDSEVHYIRKP